jgi:ribosomal-protein-alanine N-acetyltransferase
MKLETPLIGQSLFLRTLVGEDATPRYLSWLSDVEVTRYLEVRFSAPSNLIGLSDFISSTNESDDTLMLGMFLLSDGRHIGNIKLGPINRHHGTGDIGLLIGERGEWGKGHARAVIALVTNYAFTTLGLSKLTAGCYSANEGSRRAFLLAGFVEEGRQAAQYVADGVRQDKILLGKIKPTEERIAL